jgi:hypothetical protein
VFALIVRQAAYRCLSLFVLRTATALLHLRPLKKRAGEKFAVLLLVEPGTLDVEQAKPGEAHERKRVERELGDRLVGAGIGLIVENVDGTVADLNEVDVAG